MLDAPIVGLTASSSGPMALGSAVSLTATVVAGTNITDTWNFGDGSGGAGAAATHVYTTPGDYTAIVTATNMRGAATASTLVVVESPAGAIGSASPAGGTIDTGDGITLQIPPNAVTTTVTIIYTDVPIPEPSPGAPVVRGFRLTAQTSDGLPIAHFQRPITLTISYTQ